MNYNELINNLIDYGIDNHLITELDSIYIGNLVIDLIKEKEFIRLEKHNKKISEYKSDSFNLSIEDLPGEEWRYIN